MFERLTQPNGDYRTSDGWANPDKLDKRYLNWQNAMARLKPYEDTGLTPEEIAALRAENERLGAELDRREIDPLKCPSCDEYRKETDRLRADLAAMTAERDDARDKLDWLTEAYDRKMRVHDALNRDYVALRKRAGAAERDMAFACGSQPSASSDCSICDICAHKRDDGSCAKQCFMNAMAAMNRWEWRGPEEDKQ